MRGIELRTSKREKEGQKKKDNCETEKKESKTKFTASRMIVCVGACINVLTQTGRPTCYK